MAHELDSDTRRGDSIGEYVLLVGQSPLAPAPPSSQSPGALTVEIRLDPIDVIATSVNCRELTPFATTLLREILEGRRLEPALRECEGVLQRRYFGPNKAKLLQAMKEVRSQFNSWSQSMRLLEPYSAGRDAPSDPFDAVRPPEGPHPSNGSHHVAPNDRDKERVSVQFSVPDGSQQPILLDAPRSPLEATDPVAGAPMLAQGAPRTGSVHTNVHHNLATLLVTLLAHSRLLDGKGWPHSPAAPVPAET
ncbi:MAG TPA: DUF3870 domain-containing protein, partial [Chloroflexota bacterium]|nr:DUF3870 domain-containing protein [Chloroflexota bacterium]